MLLEDYTTITLGALALAAICASVIYELIRMRSKKPERDVNSDVNDSTKEEYDNGGFVPRRRSNAFVMQGFASTPKMPRKVNMNDARL